MIFRKNVVVRKSVHIQDVKLCCIRLLLLIMYCSQSSFKPPIMNISSCYKIDGQFSDYTADEGFYVFFAEPL